MNYHEDVDSETGSDDGFQGVELEVADRTAYELIWRQTVKTNVHILVKVVYTSWSNAVNTRNITSETLLAILYVIGPTCDVIVQ